MVVMEMFCFLSSYLVSDYCPSWLAADYQVKHVFQTLQKAMFQPPIATVRGKPIEMSGIRTLARAFDKTLNDKCNRIFLVGVDWRPWYNIPRKISPSQNTRRYQLFFLTSAGWILLTAVKRTLYQNRIMTLFEKIPWIGTNREWPCSPSMINAIKSYRLISSVYLTHYFSIPKDVSCFSLFLIGCSRLHTSYSR